MKHIDGRSMRLLYVVVLLVVAVPGIGVLLIGANALLSESITGLILIFAAPLWIAGLVAVAELVRLARGGRVTLARALTWSVVVLIVGAIFGAFTGFLSGGLERLAELNPIAWLVLTWLVIGSATLITFIAEGQRTSRRRAVTEPPQSPSPG